MSTQMRLAIVLFAINIVLAVAWMWDIRPRTVASMDRSILAIDEAAALDRALAEAGVDATRVRVCETGPCTRGPAVFVDGDRVRRLELPRTSRPGPLAGGH